MTVQDLIDRLQALVELNPRHAERQIKIPIKQSGAVGGTPSLEVTCVYQGFDWDKGTIFLKLEKEVSLHEPKQH